jgi:phosphoglycerate dehydrogenase-like enzyme
LTQATKGLIGERELRALPRNAYLLNPARGPILQEAALLRALEEKWITGAALDTHFHYPLPPEHPLWRLRNVILTPHLAAGGNTPRFVERFWDLLAQNVERFSQGRPLLNELTPAELAGN